MTTNQKISAAILAHRAAGKTIQEAIDAVLGAGTARKLIDEVYDELNARAAAKSVKH